MSVLIYCSWAKCVYFPAWYSALPLSWFAQLMTRLSWLDSKLSIPNLWWGNDAFSLGRNLGKVFHSDKHRRNITEGTRAVDYNSVWSSVTTSIHCENTLFLFWMQPSRWGHRGYHPSKWDSMGKIAAADNKACTIPYFSMII